MTFTAEHIEILNKHEHHWLGLRDIGVMINLENTIIEELQKVYNEVVGPEQFSAWCKDCVGDLVRLLYANYEQWKATNTVSEGEVSQPDPKGKGVKRNKENPQANV